MSLIPQQTKNKRKKKETLDEQVILIDNIFSGFQLSTFCPKKVFDVIFITEASESSSEPLENLIRTARDYEEMSCLTFITRAEVLELLDHFDPSVFPIFFRTILQETHQRIAEKSTLDRNSLARLTKLKLLEVMSRHFLKEMGKGEKRDALENELTQLAQDSKKRAKKKELPAEPDPKKPAMMRSRSLVEKKSKGRIDAKSVSHTVDVGYKLTGSSSSDIVFDDDVLNHVWFYVFQGFSDAELLEQLCSINVPIRAIIKFEDPSSNTISYPSTFRIFWEDIQGHCDGPKRSTYFENTILMKFEASGSTKEVLEELAYVIKNITDIKMTHLNYIRHIKIHQPKENYKLLTLECLLAYNSASNEIPLELTNGTTVLINLLEEVSMRMKCSDKTELKDPWKTISSQSISITKMDHCKHVCDEDIFKKELPPKKPLPKPKKTFMMHESDILSVILKTYGGRYSTFVDNLNSVLKIQKPFTLLEATEYDSHELIHKHDVDPSKKPERHLTKSQLHFLYLFLFGTFQHQDTIEDFQDTELTENLQTYRRALYQCPLVENGESDCEESPLNLYEPSPMGFIWREEIPSQVMVQEIWNNQSSYQYMDMKFSPETDNLLVQFSDRLDDFGLNTKTYDVTLRTPVCLRDFCKYVTVEESRWLEVNKPAKYARKSEEIEECKGANKINKLDMFREYRHLLNPTEMLDVDPPETHVDEEETTVTFQQNMMDIENYPSSSKLIAECERHPVKSFLAYDFGTRYFAVRGTETVFSSHDNVKIKVDNTRMIYEEPKCTVCLTCKGNSLILHSSKAFLDRKYNFHWNLKDGTVISFTLQKQHQRAKRSSISPAETDLVEEMVIETDDDDETWLQEATNQKVVNLSKADFEEELKTFEDFRMDLSNEDATNIYEALKQAILEGCPVYKISDNLTYLTRHYSKTEIPLTNIIRRLLYNKHKNVPPDYTKRFISSIDDSVNVKKQLDFRICLPNGLYITCYPSNVRDTLVEVKQEFVSEERRFEEFRLFTRDGHILVKKIDGTITMMKSSGVTIMFEKPDSQDPMIRESTLKTCHCKNLDDYRKKLNKMMKNATTANDEYYISRRDILKSKKGYVINKDITAVLESNKVPYLKRVLLSFDGNRTTLRNNKISQKRAFHTTSEQDFLAEELYFERDDGFRSLFDRNGNQAVRFADGTKISTSIRVSKELVDGFVFVSLDFAYEHPDYVTVTYDAQDSLRIHMKDVILERNSKDDIKLRIGDDLISKADSRNVTFEKLCKECDSKYSCSINISPFLGKNFDYNDEFVHAQDSYDKHFYVDFGGNTKRSRCFLKGPLNRAGCNHHTKNVYKKLFVVNRTLSGEQFWNNEGIEKRKNRVRNENNINVVEKSDIRNPEITILDFRKQHFESPADRFVNSRLLREEICLSKYTEYPIDHALYLTIRVFKQMIDIENTNTILTNLSLHFAECNKKKYPEKTIEGIIEKIYEYIEAGSLISIEKKQTDVLSEETARLCKCLKKKKSFSDKISCWKSECEKFKKLIRAKKIPLYFDSQFCEVIE